MKKVLITGGAGFIGLHIARALVRTGVHVDLVDNFSRGQSDFELSVVSSSRHVRTIELDMSVANATDILDSDYNLIFHLAAIVGVKNVVSRSYDTLALNTALTIEALRLARRQRNIFAFIFASTSEVYSGSEFSDLLAFPTIEDSILTVPPLSSPRTSYMLSKLYGEALVLQSGLRSVIVRPHNVYGPRMGRDHVIPELMRRIHNTEPGGELEVYSPTHSRTFCYIDDAVAMIIRLARNPAAIGGTWNIGTEAPEYSIMRVAEIIRDTMHADVKLVPGHTTSGSPTRRCPSMIRTDAMTGYYERTSLDDGVSSTFGWYREHDLVTPL
ncbi:NAD(P)-dependent oxidoreductase [Microvirga sp. VF16]|uniref:NAD-dependent epimerase/dehydratase family protein n=1 Tax=Microvirga sp. VF16 TaxID=2807101 RepID=UPI00193E12A5|nr:NAD(P)-dependent oxidoreductase [Microvirga sp. VF16]QRM27249.1 NAD(P)-dependent oxidoreductase [Microvirga sp. VF16]